MHEYTQDSAIKRKENNFIELQYFTYINFLMGYLNGQDGPVLIFPALLFGLYSVILTSKMINNAYEQLCTCFYKNVDRRCLELGLSVSPWLLVCLMVSPFHQLSYSKVYIKQTDLSMFGLRIDRDLTLNVGCSRVERRFQPDKSPV